MNEQFLGGFEDLGLGFAKRKRERRERENERKKGNGIKPVRRLKYLC